MNQIHEFRKVIQGGFAGRVACAVEKEVLLQTICPKEDNPNQITTQPFTGSPSQKTPSQSAPGVKILWSSKLRGQFLIPC